MQVVADKDNNTLLIVATPLEYTVIEAALKKLDIPARQVMMEVTMAEVTLNDEIDFGIDWLFKGGAPSGRGAGGLLVGTRSIRGNPGVPAVPGGTANNPVLALAQGFTYIINNANFPGGIQAVLHLLDTYGNTKVIANPHLAALDNQKATIKAGDRSRSVSRRRRCGGTDATRVTTTSQYIDTGVLLQVTPHINAGGLVTLDVQAEVSNPGNRGQPVRRAADQHALGADARQRAKRADDGDGRPHQRDQAERSRRAFRSCRASPSSAACSAIRRSPTTAPSS